jgi:hypothetical protein
LKTDLAILPGDSRGAHGGPHTAIVEVSDQQPRAPDLSVSPNDRNATETSMMGNSVDETTNMDPDARDASYCRIIREAQAYRWLLKEIEVWHRFDIPAGRNILIEAFNNMVIASSSLHIKAEDTIPPVRVTYELEWSIIDFVRAQHYDTPAAKAFDHIVCLTGTVERAYATNVAHYLEQVWPLSHLPLRVLMKRYLSLPPETQTHTLLLHSSDVVSGVAGPWQLEIAKNTPECTLITACGTADFALDIGDQLSWLSSALQSPSQSEAVMFTRLEPGAFYDRNLSRHVDGSAIVVARCRLRVTKQESATLDGTEPAGFCWRNLFRNLNLVNTHPIPRRSESSPKGLEISLGLCAQLVQSRQVVRLGDRLILKGFSSLLVATAISDTDVTWHLIVNEDGSRISYYDKQVDNVMKDCSSELGLGFLESRRHIVGWCGNVKDYIGEQANPRVKIVTHTVIF